MTDLSLTASKWKTNPLIPVYSPLSFSVPKIPKEIGYVTFKQLDLLDNATALRIEYTLSGSGVLVAQGETGTPRIALHFQKRYDDAQCTSTGLITKQTQYFRWWSSNRPVLSVGTHVLEVPLIPANFISCWGVNGAANANATTAFNSAKANVERVGFTFGSSSAGHGMSVSSGSLTFKVNRYAII